VGVLLKQRPIDVARQPEKRLHDAPTISDNAAGSSKPLWS